MFDLSNLLYNVESDTRSTDELWNEFHQPDEQNSAYKQIELDLQVRKPFKRKLGKTEEWSRIARYKGDDGIEISNTRDLAAASIYICRHLIGIKLSIHDIGNSEIIGNFAEEWIFNPISVGTTFQGATKYHRKVGIPLVLDGPKTKLLSPVRKQSERELDLESKYHDLAKAAKWVDKDWFTYDFHQLMLVLGTVVFDFSNCREFPYLYSTEGGCGGAPPWGNLLTVEFAAYHFNRGKAKGVIQRLMEESIYITQEGGNPQNVSLLHAAHLAQGDPGSYLEMEAKLKSLNREGFSSADVEEIIQLKRGTELPTTLKDKAIELLPTNFAVGSIISHLRSQGQIMTELDARIALINQKKYLAIGGNRPMRDVLEELEIEKLNAKNRGFKVIQQLHELTPTERQYKTLQEQSLENPTKDFKDVAKAYYEYGETHYTDITSFFYADRIRVFKTQDIVDFVSLNSNRELIREIFNNMIDHMEVPMKSRPISDMEDKQAKDINNWLKGVRDGKSLLLNPIPVGIGTDDARLMCQLEPILPRMCQSPEIDFGILLVTNDRKLRSLVLSHIMTVRRPNIKLLACDTYQYFLMCKDSLETRRKGHTQIANLLTCGITMLSANMEKDLIRYIDGYNLEKRIIILYDVPNIERSFPEMTFSRKTHEYRWMRLDMISKVDFNRAKAQGKPLSIYSVDTIRDNFVRPPKTIWDRTVRKEPWGIAKIISMN